MLATFRSRAALAATLFTLAACSESEKLPTTLDPVESAADVAATAAAFETPQASALIDLGVEIDRALLTLGGVAVMADVVAEGPVAPQHHEQRFIERVEQYAGDPAQAIPASLLGKTLVWDINELRYVVGQTPGAPANGVRFTLYQVDPETLLPAIPLVAVGGLEIVRTGTDDRPTVAVTVRGAGGATVLSYTATVGGTTLVPAFRVEGTAGTGNNVVNFTLTVGVNLANESVTATWRTEVPSRGVTSRTTIAFNEDGILLTGLLRAGLRKVELSGQVGFAGDGTFTVDIGDRRFATITYNGVNEPTIVGANGQPLTAEEQETLERIFEWFQSSFEWYEGLLAPIYVPLGVEGSVSAP